MADPLPVVDPKEAIAFLRQKGLTTGFAWQDVWQEEHARAFTVAKAMSRDILEDIRGEVDRALADGTTLADFRRELRPILERKGWWGRRSMLDPATGEQKVVQLGSARRLRTIFEVNMRSAYSAGRWERAERVKGGFPYLRYVTAGDDKVRPEHKAWDGVIRPIGDEFWDTHYPPCGWNCRCTAVPVSKGMIERRGWSVTEDPPSFPKETYTNPRTGEISSIERGIDPGFNFNIGKAYLDGLTPEPGDSSPVSAEAVDGFLEVFGITRDQAATGKVVVDRSGHPHAISLGWFGAVEKPTAPGRTPRAANAARVLFARIASALLSPDAVRSDWVTGPDGRKQLVRRHIVGRGGDMVAVEVGRTWRFRTSNDAAEWADAGEQTWAASDVD